jgi:hypothetical protein
MSSRLKIWPIFSLLALLAFGATPALAQEGFGVQVGGGPIFSSFDDTAGLDFDTKAGWLAGLLMGGNRGGVLGVEADVLYGKKGAKLNIPVVGTVDFEQQVTYR